jgi:hypothetical protein
VFKSGDSLFLRVDHATEERLFHRALVMEATSGGVAATFHDDAVAVDLGEEVILYFDRMGDFTQQAARVRQFEDLGGILLVDFEMISDPFSSENRANFRVTTITADAQAKIGSAGACPVRDASFTGFSVISPSQHAIGSILNVELHYRDIRYTGEVSVQSCRAIGSNLARYGLRCLDRSLEEGSLATGLKVLTLDAQHVQLARSDKGNSP